MHVQRQWLKAASRTTDTSLRQLAVALLLSSLPTPSLSVPTDRPNLRMTKWVFNNTQVCSAAGPRATHPNGNLAP